MPSGLRWLWLLAVWCFLQGNGFQHGPYTRRLMALRSRHYLKKSQSMEPIHPPVVPDLWNVSFRMKDVVCRGDIQLVRLRHIQFASEELCRHCEDAISRGDMVFDEVARSLSTCEHSRSTGGDVGWIPISATEEQSLDSSVPLELLNACCHMSKGDMSIVSRRSSDNSTVWHLLQLMDIVMKLTPLELKRRKESIDLKSMFSGVNRTYHIDTMGCQMNVADSERMEAQLQSIGFQPADDINRANVVIINTCSIRDHAEQKVYSHLGPHAIRKRNGEAVLIVVAGCVAQQEGKSLIRRFPEIDIVLGPQYSNRLVDLMDSALDGSQVVATDPAYQSEDALPAVRHSDLSAFVNVIYGCNEHCTYCVVPNTRGIEQSRTKEAIVEEVSQLVEQGYQEVTLLGQNIDAWGRDMTPKQKFADLLSAVAQVPGLQRLRFLTSHPKYMSRRVIEAVAKYDALMPCFYVPFQSGDNTVLKMMRRGYSRERFLGIVRNIREMLPNAAIIADCIVGFPGETEEQFQRSLDLMEEVKFDMVNTAAYSPRPGTPAATWNNQIAPEVKADRLQRIQAKMTIDALEQSQRYLHTVQDVLVDNIDPKHANHVSGRNPQFKLIFFEGNYQQLRGRTVRVLITEARPFSLSGRLVTEDLNSLAVK